MKKEDRKKLIKLIIFFIIWDGIGVSLLSLYRLPSNPWIQYNFYVCGGLMLIYSIGILCEMWQLIFHKKIFS